ncbi:HesA/MoeB/ThiF family protein [Methylomusa anaerophila]|uniref:Putative adenylyltransferase/sulfurtransferase MoeZ n=2 Tax=Methylomusa anaerophila TaxID=1930071 RepID=A0A348ALH6_9FIRM|nr:molybdopterin-synthase adenylyltransferase MoeB [Methylomusa anaerophila]BBB91924.1 putative adenylyltransferase/sulfurtransferase MoeZ [Methylomusa anaerophila]
MRESFSLSYYIYVSLAAMLGVNLVGLGVVMMRFMGAGSMSFSNEQMERYARHIILKEVGVRGQQKLLASKVLIIGTGGLGAPAAMFLAAAGVGTIGLADGDAVELANLQRQIIHLTKDIGKAKVLSAQETINEINPDVKVIMYQKAADASNVVDIIKDRDYDFIIDGTDNFPAKFLINDACVITGKPFSHGGIIRFQGQTLTYIPGQGPCYRCIFHAPPPPDAVPTCKQAGVLGVMGGVIGTIQATEAIKYILGVGELLNGYVLTYDALEMNFRKVKLPRDSNCPVCGENPSITKLADYTHPACEACI